jgi:predicted RNA-binding Zn-ribbon protein involved in translation (DUF1610 family)
MRLKAPKKPKGEFYLKVGDEYLSVGFVPLCAPKQPLTQYEREFQERPLTVRCPLCGLVMVSCYNSHTEKWIQFCPECGIFG